jgi:preprotein translocase subunit SecE
MYTMGMIVAGKKMNKYLLAVIITAVFGFSFFYLISQMLSSLIAGL